MSVKKKEYHRLYYQKNKEKMKEQRREYYTNNTVKVKEQTRKWRLNNPNLTKEYGKKYRENNSEKIKEENKKYYQENREKMLEQNKNWAIKNPEKRREIGRNWIKNNPEKVREHSMKFGMNNRELLNKQNKDYRKKIRKQAIEIYGGKCQFQAQTITINSRAYYRKKVNFKSCDQAWNDIILSDTLQFHHVKGGRTEGASALYLKIIKNGIQDDIQLLCANHHILADLRDNTKDYTGKKKKQNRQEIIQNYSLTRSKNVKTLFRRKPKRE